MPVLSVITANAMMIISRAMSRMICAADCAVDLVLIPG
jgi:hypothetical protein